MSKRANPTAIGLFVVLGLALTIIGLIIFSSGRLFRQHQKFILYFNNSLKGLNPGAPVKFRGVTVGSVAQVLIRHNQAFDDYYMPVIIDMDLTLAKSKTDQQVPIGNKARLEQLIQAGFRGKLDTESLLTGVLYVELDIMPRAAPPSFHELKPEYPEIPTVPTDIQQLIANLKEVDVRGLTKKLDGLIERLDTNLAQLNLPEISSGLTNLLGTANRTLANPEVTNSLVALRKTLDNANGLLTKLNERVDPLAQGATNTLYSAQETLTELRTSLRQLNELLQPDAPFRAELALTLNQLNHATRAIADLAEFLERNPNALLTGRKLIKENP